MHSKGVRWWRFKVAKNNEKCIEAFFTIMGLRCSQLLWSSGPLECCWFLHVGPLYLNNNIHNDMLMGEYSTSMLIHEWSTLETWQQHKNEQKKMGKFGPSWLQNNQWWHTHKEIDWGCKKRTRKAQAFLIVKQWWWWQACRQRGEQIN
jgi:hypothetical protein